MGEGGRGRDHGSAAGQGAKFRSEPATAATYTPIRSAPRARRSGAPRRTPVRGGPCSPRASSPAWANQLHPFADRRVHAIPGRHPFPPTASPPKVEHPSPLRTCPRAAKSAAAVNDPCAGAVAAARKADARETASGPEPPRRRSRSSCSRRRSPTLRTPATTELLSALVDRPTLFEVDRPRPRHDARSDAVWFVQYRRLWNGNRTRRPTATAWSPPPGQPQITSAAIRWARAKPRQGAAAHPAAPRRGSSRNRYGTRQHPGRPTMYRQSAVLVKGAPIAASSGIAPGEPIDSRRRGRALNKAGPHRRGVSFSGRRGGADVPRPSGHRRNWPCRRGRGFKAVVEIYGWRARRTTRRPWAARCGISRPRCCRGARRRKPTNASSRWRALDDDATHESAACSQRAPEKALRPGPERLDDQLSVGFAGARP